MSNDDRTPPFGFPNDPPGPQDLPPTQAYPPTPPPPPPDATQVFPTLPPAAGTRIPSDMAAGGGWGGGLPPDGTIPLGPPGAPRPRPWYTQPAQIGLIVFALLAVGGLILLLLTLGGDDDDADGRVGDQSDQPVSFVIVRLDGQGAPLLTSLTATVTATLTPTDTLNDPAAPVDPAYRWVIPAEAIAGQPAMRTTDATGRTEFRWVRSDAELVDPWSTTVGVTEVVPAQVGVVGQTTECTLERDGTPTLVPLDLAYQPDTVSQGQIVTYSFPNVVFVAGDRIQCRIGNGQAPLESTTTTVVVETTTTTTIPPTTTTTTTTTIPPTTTTTTTTTLPPAGSVIDVLRSRTDLSELVGLIDLAGLTDQLATQTSFTLFAPNNAAIDALRAGPDAPDLTDPATARDVVLTHVTNSGALTRQEVLSSPQIVVVFGGPQDVDVDTNPPMIGDARIIEFDVRADNGAIHVLDAVLEPTPT